MSDVKQMSNEELIASYYGIVRRIAVLSPFAKQLYEQYRHDEIDIRIELLRRMNNGTKENDK